VDDHDVQRVIRQMAAGSKRRSGRLSRRNFLKASGFASMSAYLAACSTGGGTPSRSTGTSPGPSTGGASGSPGTSTVPSASYATEGGLYMYNWSDYVAEENIAAFQERYSIDDWTYTTFESNEELLTRLQGGATGLYDVGAPTAEFVKAMADGGYIEELDFSRIPNASLIDPQFQNFFAADGPDAQYNRYHVPKDWGTTGIALRTKVVTEEVKTWRQFFDIAPKYSGRIVMVDSPGDVFTAPLKALGYSLNTTDPAELEEARQLLLGIAPHVLTLDSDTYADRLASEEAVMGLVWTGNVVDLREEPETADTVYLIPEDGTLFWLDTWVIFKDPPHPEASYAFLNFIHEPDIQAVETEWNRYATPNNAAKELVDEAILNDPTVFVPEAQLALLEGAQDVSTNEDRVRIWEEFSSSIGS
jgi:spermidine/putrescine transport system substrate-binding protein